MINGRRIRETFDTREEAKIRADQIRLMVNNEGAQAATLPTSLRVETVRCVEMLAPYAASLTEACRYYVDHVLKFRESPTVDEIVQRLIEDKERKKRRERTLQDIKERLGRFAEKFGSRQLSDITQEELEEYLQNPSWGAQSVKHHATKISMLYNFALRRKEPWVSRNLVEFISLPSVDRANPEVLTAEQASHLLEHADTHGLLPYVAVGMFAGLRPNELERLDWSNIRLAERAIFVDAGKAKTRHRRVVNINDTLAAWLVPHKQQRGPVVEIRNLLNRRNKLMKAAGMDNWPHDVLRHSFGSYFLAVSKDDTKVAYEMGNSPDIVHRHYKALVTEADANKYWSLRPKDASDTVAAKK